MGVTIDLSRAVLHNETGVVEFFNRPWRREAAGGHSGFEAVLNVHNEVTICALKPLREGETGHAHFWIPRRQLSDRLVFCASADRDRRHGACCSTRHNPIIASADSR